MEFSRQEYWIGLPFPSLGDLPNRGIEPGYPALQAVALPSEPSRPGFNGHYLSIYSLDGQIVKTSVGGLDERKSFILYIVGINMNSYKKVIW